jgi:hypothetical protein
MMIVKALPTLSFQLADAPTAEDMVHVAAPWKAPEGSEADEELRGFPLPESGIELSQKQKMYMLQNIETLESLWIKCEPCI